LKRSWGVPGQGPGEFFLPHGIAVAADGRVFVCDRENDRIQIFSPDGEYLSEWTDTPPPAPIVFDGAGRPYVAELWWQPGQTSRRYGPAGEIKSGRVSVYDRDGRVIARWGGPDPTASGSFAAPHGIAVDSKGDVYVSEVTWTFAGSRGYVPESCHTSQKFALQSGSLPGDRAEGGARRPVSRRSTSTRRPFPSVSPSPGLHRPSRIVRSWSPLRAAPRIARAKPALEPCLLGRSRGALTQDGDVLERRGGGAIPLS